MGIEKEKIQLNGWDVFKFLEEVGGSLAVTLRWGLAAYLPLHKAAKIAEATAHAIYDAVIDEELPDVMLPKTDFEDISSTIDGSKRIDTVVMKSRSGNSTATIVEEATENNCTLTAYIDGIGEYSYYCAVGALTSSKRIGGANMTVELIKFMDGTRLIATTESPASHYGIPAIVHEGCDLCKDAFGPADPVPECLESEKVREFFGTTPCMKAYVSRLCLKLQDWEIEFVNKWLAQGQSTRP